MLVTYCGCVCSGTQEARRGRCVFCGCVFCVLCFVCQDASVCMCASVWQDKPDTHPILISYSRRLEVVKRSKVQGGNPQRLEFIALSHTDILVKVKSDL